MLSLSSFLHSYLSLGKLTDILLAGWCFGPCKRVINYPRGRAVKVEDVGPSHVRFNASHCLSIVLLFRESLFSFGSDPVMILVRQFTCLRRFHKEIVSRFNVHIRVLARFKFWLLRRSVQSWSVYLKTLESRLHCRLLQCCCTNIAFTKNFSDNMASKDFMSLLRRFGWSSFLRFLNFFDHFIF